MKQDVSQDGRRRGGVLTAALAMMMALGLGVGCKERDASDEDGEPADQGAVRREGKKATERTSRPPVLRADRFGAMDATSRVEPGALARAFPGLRVERRSGGSPAFDLYRGDDKLFSITRADDGAVSSVEIVSRQVETALGARVGDRFEKIRDQAGPLECNGGLDDRARDVLCTPRRARNVTFILQANSDAFAGDDIPADKLTRLVGGRPVRSILWRPPAPARR